MSLADASVEIIANIGDFKATLKRKLREAADGAARDADSRFARLGKQLDDRLSGIGGGLRRSIALNADRAKESLRDLGNSSFAGRLSREAGRAGAGIAAAIKAGARSAQNAIDKLDASTIKAKIAAIDKQIAAAGTPEAKAALEGVRAEWKKALADASASGRQSGGNFALSFGSAARAGIASSIGRVLASAGAIAPLLGPIASVLSAGAAAAVSLGAALGAAAAGGAAALAGSLAAAASVAIAVKVGSGGIVSALKAQTQAQASSVTAATESASSQRSAARAITTANQQVAASQRDIVTAQRNVVSSQKDLKASEVDALDARKALTQAYQDAKTALRDLDEQLTGASLDERQAALDQAAAVAELQKVMSDPTASAAQREQAQINAEQAALRYKEATEQVSDLQDKQADANKKGVAGSDQVVAAKKAVADADAKVADNAQKVKDAQQGVADAQLKLADAMIARSDAVAAASEKAAGSASSADKAYADALAKLGPNARSVVTSVTAIKTAYEGVQKYVGERLTAGLSTELDALSKTFMPRVKTGLGGIAESVNAYSISLSGLLRTADSTKRIDKIMAGNQKAVDAFGGAVNPLAHAFLVVGDAVTPLAARLGDATTNLAHWIDNALTGAESSGKLAGFFDKAWTAAATLARTAGNLGRALGNVFSAGLDDGQSFLGTIETLSADFLAFTQSADGKNKIAAWFAEGKETGDQLGKLIKDVAGIFKTLSGDADASDTVASIDDIANSVGDLLIQLNQSGTGTAIIDTVKSVVKSVADANVGGGLQAFVKTLADIVRVMSDAVQKVPGGTDTLGKLGAVLGVIAAVKFAGTVSGVGKVIGSVNQLQKGVRGVEGASGIFGGIGKGIADFTKGAKGVEGASGAFASFGGKAAGATKALKEAKLGTKLLTGAQLLLNIAMDANPIGLIVLALAALVFGIIYAYKHFDSFKELLDKVGRFFKNLGKDIAKFATEAWGHIKDFAGDVGTFFSELPGKIGDWLSSLGSRIGGAFSSAMHAASDAVSSGWHATADFFTSLPGRIGRALVSIGSAIAQPFRDAWSAARSAVTSGIDSVISLVTGLPGRIAGVAVQLYQSGKNLIGQFVSGLGNIGDAVGNIGNSVVQFLKDHLNDVINGLNNFIANHINDKIPGTSFDVPRIPTLARGAIVNRATLAVVGEAGREVVVPLTRPARAVELARQSGLTELLRLQGAFGDLTPAVTVTVPAPPADGSPAVTPGNVHHSDQSVTIGELHQHFHNRDAKAATATGLRRAARYAMR